MCTWRQVERLLDFASDARCPPAPLDWRGTGDVERVDRVGLAALAGAPATIDMVGLQDMPALGRSSEVSAIGVSNTIAVVVVYLKTYVASPSTTRRVYPALKRGDVLALLARCQYQRAERIQPFGLLNKLIVRCGVDGPAKR
jgi:hypothetical protein